MSRTIVNSILENNMTEVAVQYEQKVKKLDELLTRLDKFEPTRRRATLLTINAVKIVARVVKSEPSRMRATLHS